MTRVLILGAGTPIPTKERFGTSFVAEVGDEYLLFDCGPATTYKLVRAGLDPTQIDHLFFTHHHFDHDSDYPCFLLTRWHEATDDVNQLTVYGPDGTEAMTDQLLHEDDGAFNTAWTSLSRDSDDRRSRTEEDTESPSPSVTDIGPGFVHDSGNWEVRTARATHHQPWLDPLAYRLDTTEGSVVFTGDTGPCRSVAELAQGADLLLCMCWDHQDVLDENNAAEDQLGTTQAAELAQNAGVNTIVLTHVSPHFTRHGSLEKGIGEVTDVYDGEVMFAEEFMWVSVV